MSQEEDIRIKRGELNGELCNMFRDTLTDIAVVHPKFKERKDLHAIKSTDSNRPRELPNGSIFLYAESGPPDDPIVMGSISLIILNASSPYYTGLPDDLDKVGEIKRTIVLDEFRRRGVARTLLKALEDIAKVELGLKYVAIETWWEFKAAMALYEGFGYQRREPWGSYDAHDSCCYGKWL